ncbi:unnamed protein product [Clonostachys solani]|uniref:Meiotically up-regulated protein Msb1/Mug8 domain-containing protein n=1 Tax=Clonostachys solani TaxID=160281 RepID=A0A9N9ZJY7_9HYPO|nr:unnamed protein product [Clonostachys solani]
MAGGLFARLKGKDSKSKKKAALNDLANAAAAKPQWDDAWTRQSVEPEEIHELLHFCTEELKARALDHPFLLLPFRPTSDPSAVRTFVRHFFDHSQPARGEILLQELRMAEPMVISGVAKWCWSRLQGGVVGWDAYELFKVGEFDSNMARDSFKTFIPISVENGARQRIIFDFFELLAAIAAHGKTNGMGGRKLSRMAAWWAFEQKDTGSGFEGGYSAWSSAADATSHLFFAYLRSMAPESSIGGITSLPRALQKLVQETEYPPQRPELMMSRTNKVVMMVETVSPTPFSLLRRTNHFQYRDSDRALQEFAAYEDPIRALTEECRRVLKAISSANQSQVSSVKHSTSLRDADWSRFEDVGFSSALSEEDEEDDGVVSRKQPQPLRRTPASGMHGGRPTTPSWADFLSSGFVDGQSGSNMLLPPDKQLPPIETTQRQHSSQSHRPRLESEQHLDPGELASITVLDLDDAFWWVWMSSLAPEETPDRKSAFGRCAVVETIIRSGRWLVMEEMIAGAAPEPAEGAYIAEKKGFFSWTRRGKTLKRRKSTGKNTPDHLSKLGGSAAGSKASVGPDTHARIQAKAAQLRAANDHGRQQALLAQRRGNMNPELRADKVNSVMTMQSSLVGEASSAMKWVNKYDNKDSLKDAYMSNNKAGRGATLTPVPAEPEPEPAPELTNGHGKTNGASAERKEAPVPRPPPVVKEAIPGRKPVGSASPAVPPKSPVPPKTPEPPKSPEPPKIEEPPVEPPKSPEPPEQVEEKREEVPSPPEKDIPPPEPIREAAATPEPISPGIETKKDPKKSGGFRKFFSRRNRASKLPENASGNLNDMLRDNQQTPEPQAQPSIETAVPAPVQEETADAVSPIEEETTKVGQAHDAEKSQFTQGPLEDQPAFVPDSDDEDDATPPPIARRPVAPGESSLDKHAASLPKEEKLSQTAGPGVQDRWAQIRKNAAERAANFDRTPTKPPGSSDNDDDTSAEETIESRVARIKARVAELTGNMEGVGAPQTTPATQQQASH